MSPTVSAFDAKNRLGQLLDRVQAGEQITITRHGQPVAMLVPLASPDADRLARAAETFQTVRQSVARSGVKVSRAEVRRMIDEGRR